MKSLKNLVFALALACAPSLALGQSSQAPLEKAEGYTAAEKLNQSIIDANNAAAAGEAAAQAAWRAQQAAIDQANRDALAKHDAQVKAAQAQTQADAVAAAQVKADFAANTQALAAQNAAGKAAYDAESQAYQARLDAAQATQAAYEKDLADYQACIAGDKKRCKT